jgi:hypothetical protein
MRIITASFAVLTVALMCLATPQTASAKAPGGAHWIPVQKGDSTGYINSKGSWMVRPRYLSGKGYSNGLAAVLVKNRDGKERWGYINGNGVMVVKPRFERAMPFSNGLALVDEGCHWIDDTGKTRIKFKAELCGTFSHGLAHVLIGDLWGFIDLNGKVTIHPEWDRAWQFTDGRARVRRDGQYGFVDTAGRSVVDVKYLDARPFSDGLAAVLTDAGWGFVDKFGRMKIKPKFEDIDRDGFAQNLCAASLDDQWGFINKKGNWVISPKFTLAGGFNQNRAAVSISGLMGDRTGYINPYGSWVVKAQYDDGERFEGGVAFVTKGEETVVISRKGEPLFTLP